MNSTSRCKRGAMATNISVRFVFSSPLDLEIKYPMKATQTKRSTRSALKKPDNIIPLLSADSVIADAEAKRNGNAKRNGFGHLPPHLTNMEFSLEAPMARSVKLAADFTDWDRFPLDMIQSVDGVWWTIVPLLPGEYNYRFIVDGQWCDDPRACLHVQNPFGTSNAVVQVT